MDTPLYKKKTLDMEITTPDGLTHRAKYESAETLEQSNSRNTLFVSPTLLQSPLDPAYKMLEEGETPSVDFHTLDHQVWYDITEGTAYAERGISSDNTEYSVVIGADELGRFGSNQSQIDFIREKVKANKGEGPNHPDAGALSFRVLNPRDVGQDELLSLHLLAKQGDFLKFLNTDGTVDVQEMDTQVPELIATENPDHAELLRRYFPVLTRFSTEADLFDVGDDIVQKARRPLLALMMEASAIQAQSTYNMSADTPLQVQLESILKQIPAPDSVIQQLRESGRSCNRLAQWISKETRSGSPEWLDRLVLAESSRQAPHAKLLIEQQELMKVLPLIPLHSDSKLVEQDAPGTGNTLIFHAHTPHNSETMQRELIASYTTEPDGRLMLTTNPRDLDFIRLHQLPRLTNNEDRPVVDPHTPDAPSRRR